MPPMCPELITKQHHLFKDASFYYNFDKSLKENVRFLRERDCAYTFMNSNGRPYITKTPPICCFYGSINLSVWHSH